MTVNIEKWMNAVQFNITEGWEYGWNIFGENTHALTASTSIRDWESSMIFDRCAKEVFLVEVHDFQNKRSYRYFSDASHKSKYKLSIEKMGMLEDMAYEGVHWTDLEVEEDFFEKLTSIVKGEEYDTRVEIPLNLTDEEFLLVAKQAHQLDITINQYIERVLTLAVTELKAHNGDQ